MKFYSAYTTCEVPTRYGISLYSQSLVVETGRQPISCEFRLFTCFFKRGTRSALGGGVVGADELATCVPKNAGAEGQLKNLSGTEA
jgi:hypothetical protein